MKFKRLLLAGAALIAFAACVYDGGGYGVAQNAPQVQPLSHMEAVTVGAGTQWELDGMLHIPLGASAQSPVPAVVIVSGSGASNMDGLIPGTMHPIHPYLDIARHLADNGIAVIRHDKSVYTHGETMLAHYGGAFSLYEEYITHVLSATEILRNDPRVDADRVFILGHSLGGMVAHRIHYEGGNFAGLILMGATPNSLVDAAIWQIEDQLASFVEMVDAGVITPDMPEYAIFQAQLAEFTALIEFTRTVQAQIGEMTAEQAKEVPIPLLGASAFYYWDMVNNPMSRFVGLTDAPVFVMQGERDFQVTLLHDFPMMQEIFENAPNATLRVFEGLNHMFAQSNATNHLEHATEIMTTPMSVDISALQAIVEWISQN